MSVEPFPYPIPPRRGVNTGTARLVPAQSYRSIWRVLMLLVVLQLLDLGVNILQLWVMGR